MSAGCYSAHYSSSNDDPDSSVRAALKAAAFTGEDTTVYVDLKRGSDGHGPFEAKLTLPFKNGITERDGNSTSTYLGRKLRDAGIEDATAEKGELVDNRFQSLVLTIPVKQEFEARRFIEGILTQISGTPVRLRDDLLPRTVPDTGERGLLGVGPVFGCPHMGVRLSAAWCF